MYSSVSLKKQKERLYPWGAIIASIFALYCQSVATWKCREALDSAFTLEYVFMGSNLLMCIKMNRIRAQKKCKFTGMQMLTNPAHANYIKPRKKDQA